MRLKVGLKKLGLLITATALLLVARPFGRTRAFTSTLPNRYIKISDSIAGHTNVNYELGFDTTIPGTLGSVEVEFCSNDPFPGTACTVPPGFDISISVLVSQAGTNDFSIDNGATNAHKIVFSRTPSVVGALTFRFGLSGVSNPGNTGSEYVRLRTFSGAGLGGSVTDEAGIAFTLNGDINVSTTVPPRLEFCVGLVITSQDCSNVSGDTIDLGTLKTSNVSTGASVFVVGTNADNGYTVTVSGNSLTSGNNVLKAMTSLTVSTPGTNQFGMNLRANISPSVGAEPSGAGLASPVGNYAVPDNFIFKSGDVIASTPTSDNFRKFTVSYIANIDGNQPGGYYATTLNYTALANF